MEIDFEELYTIPLTALRLNRSHPEVPRNKKWLLQFLLLHGAFTVVYCVMAFNIVVAVEAGNFFEASRNGIVSVIYFVVSFQYFILSVKNETILKIIDLIQIDFQRNIPDDEKATVLEYAKKGNNICRQWFILVFICGAAFPIKHLIMELYLYVMGDFELVFIFPLVFPSPIEEYKKQPVVFSIITFSTHFYAAYGCCMYIGFFPLGLVFMLHACGQLEIVKNKALVLYSNTSKEETKERLIEIVKHLQYIYRFVDLIKDSFRVIYEISMKGSAILLPVTVFQVLTSFKNGEFSVEFITFIIAGFIFSGLPCYYSDMLMEKSENVRLAIYCCGWEAYYDRDARSIILFLLQRALRPCSIQTMFRALCLDALTDIYQQAYAIFNLMNAAWG